MITILEFVKEAHLLQLGKLKIETSPISLKKCWDQVLLDFEVNLRLKNIKAFETEWPKNDIVNGHEQILTSHVFSNLLSNAIKFSLPNSTIWFGAQVISESEISFYISDEGSGIPESKIKDLFELKKPTTSTGSALERGSGLGLPIVQFFLFHLGTNIQVYTRFNSKNEFFHGTLFEIRFKKVS
ncbi:MAG: sensor histidine kinase [Bdellovibrionales bacterium]